ncbi:molybdopterin-dependent oxidoreductase [Microvirga terricola]|uniref:Molybdopterin-dependent oxidoreductase n=1 Tax=Microvirga terricola TaxID=2719797 RepID=A0ABX0V8D0_9HYPH|nr:molybdopterin-dependent oxidoreductase [Microvirga terricola]NIX75952.1 molybdopterin-dependent oxidoreductase [Microvirga terricola]
MATRRSFMIGATLAAPALLRKAVAAEGLGLDPHLPAGTLSEAALEALPGKVPLIKLSYRPPNYETPLRYFNDLFTPNDAFFVRYHLSDIPEVDPNTWGLTIGGDAAAKPFELTLDALKRDFAPIEIAALCQCAGNRRGLFDPHVPGVEWGYGAMGNARWKGVRLKDILERANLAKETIEISFQGTDGPAFDKTPHFVKSIPIWKALDPDTLVAYEMNGQALPHFNGAPARIVVPGWAGTYWMKHVTRITARSTPEDNFWMKAAYRIPTGKFPLVQRFLSQETVASTPITEMVVNSVITAPAAGDAVRMGSTLTVKGVAWDGGYGITSVEVSTDEGQSWARATLGPDVGRYSFRPWTFQVRATSKGPLTLMARASNAIGQTQTSALIQNPAGYHHNLMHRVSVTVA